MKNLLLKLGFFAQILFLGIINASADTTLPGKCQVALPKILNNELISEKDVNTLLTSKDWGQSNKTDKYWTVYSDRENNETYNRPSKTSGRFATLSFNQTLRIAKIQDGFALVYEEGVSTATNLQINKGKSFGWVPMDHLLLWSSCPTNEKGIYNKALPVINIDEYKKSKGDVGKVYKNPDGRTNASELKTGMDFYFVMKSDKNSGLMLLAKECSLSGYSDKVLYGWVSKSSYVSWNQRSCLEPNWNPEAAEKMSGQSVNVYRNTSLSDKACEMPLGRTNNIGTPVTKYRMYPDEMRYPVLGNETEKALYKVTSFATPDGKSHIHKIRQEGDKSFVEKREEALKEASTVNLIVVIDGTSSMKDFYDPTQKIIQQANDYFSKQEGNIIKVGVVIYRDYEDGQYLTEYFPMKSPTDANLAKFLKTGGKYGVRSIAKSATEGLYKGLELALDASKMGYSKNHSNLMFVIGDCGNDPQDSKCLSANEIIKRCSDLRVQVSAFQVFNGTSQAYKLFRSQMNEIIRESLKKQYGVGSVAGLKVGWQDLADGYEFKTNLAPEANFYIGNTRNAANGEKMALSKLYNIVKDSYIQFNSVIARRKAAILNAEDFVGMVADSSVSERTAAATVSKKFIEGIFDKKALDMIRSANMLMAFEGYSQKKDNNSGHDYWKPVVYISDAEFNSMMRKLQPVMSAANEGSDDRKPYIEAMKALTRIMVPDITESQMMSMGNREIMALVAGLPVVSEAAGRSLTDLGDKKVVKQEEFENLISEFKNKYSKLDRIKDQGYKFSIKRNNTTWYWIPVEDLP